MNTLVSQTSSLYSTAKFEAEQYARSWYDRKIRFQKKMTVKNDKRAIDGMAFFFKLVGGMKLYMIRAEYTTNGAVWKIYRIDE